MALTGRRLVTRKRYSVTEFWSDVRRYGATMAFAFTAPLYQQPPRDDDADHTLRTLFAVPMIPEHREFDRRFGVRTRTMFGMTELGVAFASGAHVDDYRSCGRAVAGPAGLEVRLVDEHDMEMPIGQIGELVARTRRPWALNAGYFRMPGETAHAWRNGWFHTGDGFRRDERGNYYFVERLKDYIRRRGENISAYEVEAAANRHPDVLESAAIAVPSDTGEDEVKICIVAVAGRNPTADDIWAHLQESLPKYMVPRYVEFLDALPRTVTMKVRKVDLRADALNRRTKDRLSQSEGTTTS
jgi:crotonobetaine/carnitine-CoA ligase